MKPEPTEIRVEKTRPRQAQEVWTGQQEHWRSQRKLDQGREPRALGPVGSHESEFRPLGGSEVRENTRNDSHMRERISLKAVPGLEKRVLVCGSWRGRDRASARTVSEPGRNCGARRMERNSVQRKIP